MIHLVINPSLLVDESSISSSKICDTLGKFGWTNWVFDKSSYRIFNSEFQNVSIVLTGNTDFGLGLRNQIYSNDELFVITIYKNLSVLEYTFHKQSELESILSNLNTELSR